MMNFGKQLVELRHAPRWQLALAGAQCFCCIPHGQAVGIDNLGFYEPAGMGGLVESSSCSHATTLLLRTWGWFVRWIVKRQAAPEGQRRPCCH